jgi:prepilin-type N-terminal cleavage/methylation domain-containing protein
MKQQIKRSRKNTSGFTLVELTVAMFVLTVGVLGGMIMIVLGMTRDNTNRMDTTATNAAQAVLEAISAVPANVDVNLQLTDCANVTSSVTTAGATGNGTGATLNPNGNGDVDFTQATVANYAISYTVCNANGQRTAYDVRWHITTLPNGAKLVVVAAGHPTSYNRSHAMAYIAPVSLRTIVGM